MRYVGIGHRAGFVIEEKDAFEFALNAMRNEPPEDKQAFVEWFFSGNYIREDGDDTGQSKTCWLDFTEINRPVHFSIQYKSATKTYTECFDIDLTAAACLPTRKYATDNKELLSISYSLQEILLKNL